MLNFHVPLPNLSSLGSEMHGMYLVDEIRDLMKMRTAIMVEKCLSKKEVVMCPKPRRQQMRFASPPYYSGSPPIRSSNPLVQDARFQEQPNFGNSIGMTKRMQSILTMA
ncbi:hypothetical protein GIB67_002755 [Kingdonia uniflora]|uniref:Uncharacterized protein n=1 Tax=Kingdonia uniflora TaxID=39325 RepID=A0A7J7MQ49_9MAGN|nr:hypothetical protein GIB67_002755 [Kingdonia uniflora]